MHKVLQTSPMLPAPATVNISRSSLEYSPGEELHVYGSGCGFLREGLYSFLSGLHGGVIGMEMRF